MPFDWDVATELVFRDEKGYEEWIKALGKDGGWKKVVEDEEKFLDRSKTRSTVVSEYETLTGVTAKEDEVRDK